MEQMFNMDISKFKIKEMSIDDIDSCLDIV